MSGITAANWAAAKSLGLDEANTEVVATALGLIHVLQVYTSCMVTLAVWDWLVCLKSEWRYIWLREWGLVKCLYIWTRYYGLLCFALNLWLYNGNFTVQRCQTLHYLVAATCMWVTIGSDAILTVRTYAFLGKKPIIGIFLTVLLIGETGFLIYIAIAGVHQNPQVFPESPCTASDAPGRHVVSGFWLAPLCFDLICTFLTVYKAFQLKTVGVLATHPIMKIFLREGISYFFAVASVNILNAAFMFQSNANIQNINSCLALVLSQVLCCRLVLNLRATREGNGTSNTNLSSNSMPHPSLGPTTAQSGINIPLNRLRNVPYNMNDDVYGGVKVQVDVEHQ
ncbi:hypothetical protein Moror_9048 [Moniliophthora roreri MCA 2997]|uniref:DUF6533 domain-containing protein n=1 Tax=Moniliophthora roreri (strain MCA 2997) TaxID=1381753 RepID=V2XGM9_MONRO|nr:hypothetical protein Moror_9048 [Moniliophthora roreri MCA 2997]